MIKASTAAYAAQLLRVSLGRVLTAQTVTFESPGKYARPRQLRKDQP